MAVGGDGEDGRHVHRMAEDMHRHHRPHPAAAGPVASAPLVRAKGGGLDVEIQRLEDLAASLGESAKDDTRADRSELISNYTKLVEALRRMKGDRPDIDQAEGKMVPVDEADKVLAARDNALVPLLKGMAKRLAPICANRPAVEVEAEVENEVGQIMRQVEAAL